MLYGLIHKDPLANAQENLEGAAMKWSVSVLRESGETERAEVADFELSAFFTRISAAEGKASDDDAAGYALPRCRDADDQKFLIVAARCQADLLLTRDKLLLRLDRHRRLPPPFSIVTAARACELLGLGAGG